jgi:hypothetical protein
MEIKSVPIEQVVPWGKNPRGIMKKDYVRLKKQIAELGVYKPLIAVRENGKYIILGGNMRIRALKEMGLKKVDISIVKANTEAARIKYALSDNDRAGYYEGDKLAELILPNQEEIKLGNFRIEMANSISLKDILNSISSESSENDKYGNILKDEVKEITIRLYLTESAKRLFDDSVDIVLFGKQALQYDKAMRGAFELIDSRKRGEALAKICQDWITKCAGVV